MAGFKLSSEQQAVVAHRGGHLQVVACAGSGKTESVARRIAGLIQDGESPASIVAFTFTERAAAELSERIALRVAEAKGQAWLDRLSPMYVGTIHGYCFQLLQTHVPRFGNYDVLDEHRHVGLLSREYFHLGLQKLDGRDAVGRWMETVDVISNELIDADDLEGDVADIYRAYRETLDRYHVLTFGLIIQHAVEALGAKDIFKHVHGPLRHLVVDEYQDVNPAQERLVKLLAKPPVNLCVVGDDDQCIYEWRGSQVSHILKFDKRHKGVTTLTLSDNRRSRPGIVTTANDFARGTPGRMDKSMRALRAASRHALVPWRAATPEAEAERIATTVVRLHAHGYRYRDIAILCRSVRTSAPPVIDALRARGVPVSSPGRAGLFLQPEINALGEVYAWLVDESWRAERYGESHEVTLGHVLPLLQEHFAGGRKIAGLARFLEEWKSSCEAGEESVSLVGDLYRLLFRLGVHEIDPDTPEGSVRLGHLARFSTTLADFEHTFRRGRYVDNEHGERWQGGRDRGLEYFKALHRYLLWYARDAYDGFAGEMLADTDAVDVLTIHQAKGLEWPVVFMPALVKSRFPSMRTGRARNWLLPDNVLDEEIKQRYQGSIEEERRLFYVALTRARDVAYLSHFEHMKNRAQPSPFFAEIAGKKVLGDADLPLPTNPESAAAQELPALQVSFSDIALFEECGYRYRLANQFGFEQEVAAELGYGKALHHVLRRLAECARASGRIPGVSELEQLVRDEFYLPLANKPAFDQMSRAGRKLVERYVSQYAGDLSRVWATERPFALHVADGVISGRADVIFDGEQGRPSSLALVDYKIANAGERDERYRQQLQVYAAAGRGEGLEVEAAYLHELSTGARASVPVEPEAARAAVAGAEKSLKQIRCGDFRAAPVREKCKSCDYHRVCRHTVHKPR